MTARDRILGAVRAALGPSPTDPAAIAAAAAALLVGPAAIRPTLALADPVAAFAARVVSPKVGASLDRIATAAELPSAVHHYLAAQALPPVLALQADPALRALDWSGITLRDAAGPDEAAALGLAAAGIAETGSLVFRSGATTAVLDHFLPLHHLAVVHADTIVPYLEDFAAIAGVPPRNLNLITGASGTTDIEGSYVRGAHGPRFLHIILIGGPLR